MEVLHNKYDKPLNLIKDEEKLEDEFDALKSELPSVLGDFFIFLKSSVLLKTRVAYLKDIKYFLNYQFRGLNEETKKSENSKDLKSITFNDLDTISAKDVNYYLDYLRRYKIENNGKVTVYKNSNRSLARKKSALSTLFKYLYRVEALKKNITLGFNPIRLPKKGDKEIKALRDDEVKKMLDIFDNSSLLSKKQQDFFNKTKSRDKLILLMFLTYGLRLFELSNLNISSFNFSRGEFKVYRKRDKESVLPLNNSIKKILDEYINNERRNFLGEVNSTEDINDALFLSLQGKRLSERQIRELVKKYTSLVLGTTLKNGYSPHKLRATTATSLIERGESIYDVKELLNHENIETTQIYAKSRKAATKDLVKSLEWEDEFLKWLT